MSFEILRRPGAPLQLEPALYVVATPIGNLADITLRALQVLDAADTVLAEDTRVTRRLLDHFGLQRELQSCHEHNEDQRLQQVLDRLARGESVALVSDAGTPLVSDPGFPLVRGVRAAGHAVVPVPGASAVTAALSAAGLPCDRFVFEGFLPAKPSARRQRLQELAGETRTLVCYEAGRRIPALLADLADAMHAGRRVVLLRELTKLHEETVEGEASVLAAQAAQDDLELRGEFVVLVAGATGGNTALALAEARRVRDILAEGMSASQAARFAARITGVERRRLYDADPD